MYDKPFARILYVYENILLSFGTLSVSPLSTKQAPRNDPMSMRISSVFRVSPFLHLGSCQVYTESGDSKDTLIEHGGNPRLRTHHQLTCGAQYRITARPLLRAVQDLAPATPLSPIAVSH